MAKNEKAPEQKARDRAILIGRLSTAGGVAGALGLTWAFSNLSAAYFSGKPPATPTPKPPTVPVAAAPVQQAPSVIQTVVHHPYTGHAAPAPGGGTAPRPPSSGPAPPPPPPPPPVCHSTPSKPC